MVYRLTHPSVRSDARKFVICAVLALVGCQRVIQPEAPRRYAMPEDEIAVYATPRPNLPPPTPIPENEKPPVGLPSAPGLSSAGHDLILEFETDGRSGYKPHPEWPRGQSGITVGIGYDCGYMSARVIRQDWHRLPDRYPDRLAETAGVTGTRAAARLSTVVDILVQWEYAAEVFDDVDVAREFGQCRHTYPGFDDLRANAQAALISLGFNRGYGMSGPSREEMRSIRDDGVPHRDYEFMAEQLRKMVRVWKGTAIEHGMTRRRLAEARLMETP